MEIEDDNARLILLISSLIDLYNVRPNEKKNKKRQQYSA